MENYNINPGKLELAKGQLAAKLERQLTWREFSTMCKVSPHTFSNIRNGRSGGSVQTAERITAVLRSHGVAWTLEHFLPESSPLHRLAS